MKVRIEKLDNYGRGLAHLSNKIVFVPNALPNEVVEVDIVSEKKKYIEGIVKKYYATATNRKNINCPYYNLCGGCSLEHLSFEDENTFKEEKVKAILKKYANENIENLPIKSKEMYHYRNKITFHIKDNKLGFYKDNTNSLVEIDNCLLANRKINSLIEPLKALVKINSLEEIMIRTSNDERFVLVKLTGKVSRYESLLPLVDVLLINDKVITTNDKILTTISSKKYYLSADAFFQINKDLTKDLYDVALEEVKNNSLEKALDLYCGTGTIGIYISKYLKEVIGIDKVKENISNANKNRELNNALNCKFLCAKVEDVIDNYKGIDLIIVDPPRAGLKGKVIETILKILPKELIYISCDVITLARDLKILKNNYDIKLVQPFNMFPRTYHVECACILKRKE